MDPPYCTEFYDEAINLIISYELLSEDGIIITESDKELKLDDKYDINLLKEKKYGRKIVNFYTK